MSDAVTVDKALAPASLNQSVPTWRLVLSLSWPVLVQQVLILLVGLSDQYLGGRFPPPDRSTHLENQAAQTTGVYLSWFITNFTMLVTVGSTALVARFVGAGDWSSARRATGQSILLAVVFGLLGTVVGLTNLHGFVHLLKLEGGRAIYAAAYVRPLFQLVTFQVIEAAGIACLIGAGDTRTGMWVRGGVALLNLPLAWSFFLGLGPFPRLGFPGITTGTAVSHGFGAVAVLAVLVRGRSGLRLEGRSLWPDVHLLYRILRVSIPAGVDSLALVVGQLWFLRIVNGLEEHEVTAHGIALGWEALGYLSGSAFGTAAMALVGQNLGIGDRGRRPTPAGWPLAWAAVSCVPWESSSTCWPRRCMACSVPTNGKGR